MSNARARIAKLEAKVKRSAQEKAEPVRVAFPAIIKSVKSVIDSAGDKVGTLVLAFRPEGTTVADIEAIQKPNAAVYVVIMERQA
jgi:pyoverdine/dityrosine biosynthesis protein Dit1